MPRTTKTPRTYPPRARHRTRVGGLLCAVSVLVLGPSVLSTHGPSALSFVAQAHAQQLPDAATEELFLAVDSNDLDGVRAAIGKGADVEARDFSGTQPVDMAIDRGYFDIAHYLISVRNAAQAKQSGLPAQPTPTVEELAQSQSPVVSAPDAPSTAMNSMEDANPFDIATLPPEQPSPQAEAPVDPLLEDLPPAAPQVSDAPIAVEPDPFAVSQPSDNLAEPNVKATPQIPDSPYKSAMQINPDPAFGSMPEVAPETAPEATPETPPEPAPIVQVMSEPPASPSPAIDVVTPEPTKEETAKENAKPSAAKTFITTFFDFFKPPNVTGVVRREHDRAQTNGSVSEEELANQLHQIEAERGDAVIKGPEVPISPEELAKQLPPSPDLGELTDEELAALQVETPALPPYAVGSPPPATGAPAAGGGDAFGDLQIDDATLDDEQPLEGLPPAAAPKQPASSGTAAPPPAPDFKEAPGVPGKRYDPTKPFGGGVDPDVLAWLGLDPRTALVIKDGEVKIKDPEIALKAAPGTPAPAPSAPAAEDPFADPFAAMPEDTTKAPAVSDLLEGLGDAQEVASKEPKSPPSPEGIADDPFAAPPSQGAPDDPFSSPPPPTGGDVDELAGLLESTQESVSGTKGWDVTKVEGADLPSEAVVLSEIEPSGQVLDGVELALGSDTKVGQEVGEDRLKLLDQESIHKPCISKGGTETVFCIDTVSWPFELEEYFLVDTIMYQGTRAVARYDAGRATNFHSLFRSEAFEHVIGYYTKRYGPPTEMIERAIAPLAAPRQANPTYLWQSREPGTDTVVTLEIRKFDDALSGFPDTNRGALLLYRSHAKPIFPQLSQLELMVLKADAPIAVESTAPTPGDVWN
ncbi:ankyrin repeat domain-containing protein [Magnetovibrio sp.]|uniref:ankyrin repeat domain-containing protein n=1 Tax=Magnetovibrio sp. TaxID=2024836 RepID=UPI002F95E150